MPENYSEEPPNDFLLKMANICGNWAPLPIFDPCPSCEVLKRTARSEVPQGIPLARQKAAVIDWLVVWLPFFIFPYIGNNHPN